MEIVVVTAHEPLGVFSPVLMCATYLDATSAEGGATPCGTSGHSGFPWLIQLKEISPADPMKPPGYATHPVPSLPFAAWGQRIPGEAAFSWTS